jgi:hypothetical protein
MTIPEPVDGARVVVDTGDDERTAIAELRNLLAETEGLRRNGPASDGRGWFRTKADRNECYAVADSLLPHFRAEWEYGVRWNPDEPDAVHECDDQDHAREWRRDLNWEGPVVRRLVVRHVGPWQEIPA